MGNIEKIIETKVNTLPASALNMLQGVMMNLCGDRVGKMKYVPIKGIDLGSFANRFCGTDEREYISCVVDAISILSASDTEDVTNLCTDYGMIVAKTLGIPVGKCVNQSIILGKWAEELLDVDIESQGKYSNEDTEDFDEADSYAQEDEDYEETPDVDESDAYAQEDEEEENTSERDESEAALREEIKKVFNSTIISLVSKVKKRYDLLFESGYDLERPYGMVDASGILYVDSERVLKTREDAEKDMDFSASMNMFELFRDLTGFNLSDARSAKSIAQDVLEGYLNGNGLVYFPYKLLEYAYGRNASKDDSKVYNYATVNGKGVSTKWGEFSKKIVEDVKLTLEDSISIYCLNVLSTGLDRENIRKTIRTSEKMHEIQKFIEYVADSLSTCIIIIQYKSIEAKPVGIKLRVCDPTGRIGNNMTLEIISRSFSGNTGGSEGVTLSSGLNLADSEQYRVFEYGHEFNHSLSNAMPLFAYKAFEKLKEKGEGVQYKNLILGQSTDGTILRNGTHGLVLDKKLFHYINAGSRSGKGVMTLNMLAAAILSNKAVIYLDDKPDMVSMLAQLCGGEEGGNINGPLFFGLNGSNYVDDKQKQFTNQDNWISRANIPIEAVTLFGEPTWSRYGEIFYMKAFTLAFGIILARGLDGGHGRMSDPNYNGTDGIYLVCDETNVLQENFKLIGQIIADKIPLQAKKFASMSANLEAVYKEANSEGARKGADLKYANNKRDFEEAYNASKFYALSYLNSLSDNIAYIYQKSLAGFLPKEAECSDVVIIGQNLEQIPISKDTITSAVTSGRLSGEGSGANGLGGTQIAKEVKGATSIPLAHFVFNSADALIGYNSLHPEYLAQSEKGSKAFGRLDLTANNFCYLPNFKISASSEESPGAQLTKNLANDTSSVYFKPYLILNNSSPAYTSQMYDRVSNAGLTQEDVIREYPNESGNDVSPYVGFPEYMALMGVSDIAERLKKGAEVANYVVGSVLNYPDDGSGRPLWLQFATDLRPEWLLSVRDVACMCGGLSKDANITKGNDNPIIKEYLNYVNYVHSHPELGIVDNTMSCDEAYYTDENGEVQYDITGYESSGRKDFYASDDGSDEEYESQAFDDRMAESLGFDSTYDDNEELFDIFGDENDIDEESGDYEDINSYSDGYEDISSFSNSNESAFAGSDESNQVGGNVNVGTPKDERDLLIANLIAKLQENGIDVGDLGGYSVSPNVTQGVDCGYARPDDSTEFAVNEMNGMNFDENNEEITAETFANLIQLVTNKVINTYGGLERINTFRVIGGAIVVNGTVFRSKISKDCIGILPLDIRKKLATGNLSELFNYSALLSMPNLRCLEFDSVTFVYDNVRQALGYNNIGVDSLFADIPSLQALIIGSNEFTRQNYKTEMQKDDIFHYQSKATKYASVCDDYLSGLTNKSWSFTKNMFNSRNHGIVAKTFGVIFGGAASAVTGVATLGAKATKGISHRVDSRSRAKRVGDKAKAGFNVFKGGLNSLFND